MSEWGEFATVWRRRKKMAEVEAKKVIRVWPAMIRDPGRKEISYSK